MWVAGYFSPGLWVRKVYVQKKDPEEGGEVREDEVEGTLYILNTVKMGHKEVNYDYY